MTKYYVNKKLTADQLVAHGFRHESDFLTKFYPVMFYQTKNVRVPTAWVRVRIDLAENSYDMQVMHTHEMIDSVYYSEYGNADTYRKKINHGLHRVIESLCYREILERRRK